MTDRAAPPYPATAGAAFALLFAADREVIADATAAGLGKAEQVSVAALAYCTAAARFDPARGTQLSTYAVAYMRGHLRKAIRKRLRWLTACRTNADPRVLDRAVPPPAAEWEEAEAAGHAARRVAAAMRFLNDRHRLAVQMRFGIGRPASTLRQVGAALGLSGERARAIINTALGRLRAHLADTTLES